MTNNDLKTDSHIYTEAPDESTHSLQDALQGSSVIPEPEGSTHIAASPPTEANNINQWQEVLMGTTTENKEKGGVSAHRIEELKYIDAKANAQGGRWLSEEEARIHHHGQLDQPEVKEALHKLHTPEVQEKLAAEEKVRHNATGGRW